MTHIVLIHNSTSGVLQAEEGHAEDRELDEPGGDVHHDRRLRLRRRRRPHEGEALRPRQEHGVARHGRRSLGGKIKFMHVQCFSL